MRIDLEVETIRNDKFPKKNKKYPDDSISTRMYTLFDSFNTT